MPKTRRQVKEFMDREQLASFATVDSENRPHVVPVFFTYDDGKVYVQTSRESVKARNLARNKNVALAVYSQEEAVIIMGGGRILEDDEEFVKRTRDHIGKYRLKLDEHSRDSLGIPLFDRRTRCIVEVAPKRTIFW